MRGKTERRTRRRWSEMRGKKREKWLRAVDVKNPSIPVWHLCYI